MTTVDVRQFREVELAFAEHGFDIGSVTVARGDSVLHHTRLWPDGGQSLWEIDGTALGVPEVVQGAIAPGGLERNGAERTIRIGGPNRLFGAEPTVAGQWASGTGARIMRRQLLAHPARTYVTEVGREVYGAAAGASVAGHTLQGLADSLADDRGEGYRFRVGEPGRFGWILDWAWHGRYLAAPPVVVRLEEGYNCEVSGLAYGGAVAVADLVTAAAGFGGPDGLVSAIMRAPAGRVVGRNAALDQVLTMPVARGYLGQGTIANRPEAPDKAAVEAAMRAALQRGMIQRAAVELRITRRSSLLWGVMPRDVVLVWLTTDDTGYFDQSLAYVRTTSYQLRDGGGEMKLSADLFALAPEA
jgi:hypothetical protein